MSTLTLKAQCTIFRNSLQINCKKKSKLATIVLEPRLRLLIITAKSDGQVFKFPVQKLKTIHKKFIDEGKITIEFDSNVQAVIVKGLEVANENINNEGNYQIMISNGCRENLLLLVQQLVALKKQQLSAHAGTSTEPQQERKKKKVPSSASMQAQQQHEVKRGRKFLFQLASTKAPRPSDIDLGSRNSTEVGVNKHRVRFGDIPHMILRQIFEYTGTSLGYRLISKQVQKLILRSIVSIRFREDVEEQTFNKLAKWAVNIEARPRNVKTLKLQDRYDCQQLIKNKAKTLKFGHWKQLSIKHISHIKTLRVYCLQIPYMIKFQSSNLIGLRLVELRLRGRSITSRNPYVKQQDVLYIINNIKDIKVIEIAYATTRLLAEIKDPARMYEISIGMLNRVGHEDWCKFGKFAQLRVLAIDDTQKHGSPDDHTTHQAQFPDHLQQLSLGFVPSPGSVSRLPHSLLHLRLVGSHFLNSHLQQFYLPCLRTLDLTHCPNLTPQCLNTLANIRVNTNWDRARLDYASRFYYDAGIVITSARG